MATPYRPPQPPPRNVHMPYPLLDESALETETTSSPAPSISGQPYSNAPPKQARVSFTRSLFHRPSVSSRLRDAGDNQDAPPPELPPIPSALPLGGPAYTTPLPIIPLTVLSIAMLGEFLSANVSAPFVLFMVDAFGVGADEAETGYLTGILVSVFFITQFLTSLLWATVADRHGTRTVLFISLLGSAITCTLFGTSKSFNEAVAIRLLQGIFAGAIGVARSTVSVITDPTNEGRAYAIIGFCWGFGGVSGAIIGGSFESPAKKWPSVFGNIPLFVNYPYLLPCAIASSVTLLGAILSLFTARDGGLREGAIRLFPDKLDELVEEEEEDEINEPHVPLDDEPAQPPRVLDQLKKKVSMRFAGFARRVREAQPSPAATPTTVEPGNAVPLSSSVPSSNKPKPRTFSRTSRVNGTAYGYRSRLGSLATVTPRRGSLASTARWRRRESADDTEQQNDGADLNLAQRLLLANEFNATNMADLWVAAAINVDNEDPFESDSEDESIVDRGRTSPTPYGRRPSVGRTSLSALPPRLSTSHHRPSPQRGGDGTPRRPRLSNTDMEAGIGVGGRRFSSSSHLPAIFSHTGVRTPSTVVESPPPLNAPADPFTDNLMPIIEGQSPPSVANLQPLVTMSEKPPSTWTLLPLLIIVQYGLLALHSTTHDQIFYLYLVSSYKTGGLGLNAAHFAQLIALMCLAQIAYQFYLYPNIGPPRGRFSHLAMFRIGSLLFIPSYLSVTLYRVFASSKEDGNFLVMTALALSTAVRYCGSTFTYTSVAILLNYMSPPHVVGMANGLAQSIVSLARFVGPVLGGYLWSVSIEDNPSGYPFGFFVCSAVCAIAILHSFVIR